MKHYCKECNAEITHDNCDKKILSKVKFCTECRKKHRKNYLKQFHKVYKPKTKLQQKQEPLYNVATVQPKEAQKVLEWFEKAHFDKFGVKYKALTNFGGNW